MTERWREEREDEQTLVGREEDKSTSRYSFEFPSITEWWQNLNKQSAISVLVLVYVNLINYMDRSTVAGMLEEIKRDKDFDIKKDKYLGLLQTVFVFCYLLFAPIFGYLGDRYSRKWILGIGIGFWSLSTLIGSFMKSFPAFLVFRALVGVGEASYSTVAPAIISDLFAKDDRSSVLALFYFAIPVGTGLGYIVGSEVSGAFGDWRWGLRVTPIMGAIAVFMIIFFMTDPPRGKADGSHLKPTSPVSDVRALGRNKSFVLSTIAFTCVTYCAGAMMWWGPNFAYAGAKSACGNKAGCSAITLESISYKFGIVMTLSGLLGVPVGSYASQMLRHQFPNADPLVCGFTLLSSVPVLFFGFFSADYSLPVCYALTFFAGLLLNANWSIVSDMTLYIVIPPRRSIASATQILVSHLFGDAISPYLVGAMADAFKPYLRNASGTPSGFTDSYSMTPEEYGVEFKALQYSLFSCCFAQALGALFFMIMSWYILDDKNAAERQIHSNQTIPEDEEGGEEEEGGGPIFRGAREDVLATEE
ncbi:protein spinster [Eurytemora carolleeae]|uniref:protein spinster n=1 Tax=Eurytemora carolleeae TaxID=1294199 RepID=UPI000C761BD2|nr:protein spinster [Eurytemora carolleeae]XP_023325519.1 protein spinster [Eurytemora carolleeae]|eukprot:XP_023325518.1 protein spinster-like [Eurytemora affinis]